jgi:hypothetical protein
VLQEKISRQVFGNLMFELKLAALQLIDRKKNCLRLGLAGSNINIGGTAHLALPRLCAIC